MSTLWLDGIRRPLSLYLGLIASPARCCILAMASCLSSLSNRKWPPLCCCCRLKAPRLTGRPKPPFWSQRTESRQQREERRKGGHGAEVRSLRGGCYREGAMGGKMAGREKELKHGDHSFAGQSSPRRDLRRRGRRALPLPPHRGRLVYVFAVKPI